MQWLLILIDGMSTEDGEKASCLLSLMRHAILYKMT